MNDILAGFHEAWVYDFEFPQDANLRPVPICMVAKDLISGRTVRLWQDELDTCPFDDDPGVLHISYNAVAEISCHLALGWPVPARVLDLYVEFKNLTNGKPLTDADRRFLEEAQKAKKPGGKLKTTRYYSLLAALNYYGQPYLDAAEKARLRDMILTGGPWSTDQQQEILDYCQVDVTALERLLPAMAPHIDVPRALYRGRYQCAVARMEHVGIPLDLDTKTRISTSWETIRGNLIRSVDAAYGVYDGQSFRTAKFEQYLAARGWAWPRCPSGAPMLDRDTFKDMARSRPELNDLHELRGTLGKLRLNSLTVGADGRNRTSLFPFSSKTSRNQPSNAKFIFGPATWMRGLIQPPEGYGLAYIDYSTQEWQIAAALSGDKEMLAAYASGDVYLAFAKRAGAVPADATKKSHEAARNTYKQAVLGIQYGMEAEGLALRIGQSVVQARSILAAHKRTYAAYWAWSDNMVAQALFTGKISTVFGWTFHLDNDPNPRALANFPIQANAAEMMRLAACLATEGGLEVAGPVHDAFLIVAPLGVLDEHVTRMQAYMAEASRVVLDGHEVRSDAKIVRYPDRYMDEGRGRELWEKVMAAMDAPGGVAETATGCLPECTGS